MDRKEKAAARTAEAKAAKAVKAAAIAMTVHHATTSASNERTQSETQMKRQSWFISLYVAALLSTALFAATLDFDHPLS
jgi:hypothetical protein